MQRKKYIYKKISDLVWVWGSLKWIEVLLQEDEIQYCCMLVMSHYHHIYSSILSIQRKKILHKKQYNYNWYIAFLLLLVKSNLKPNWNIWKKDTILFELASYSSYYVHTYEWLYLPRSHRVGASSVLSVGNGKFLRISGELRNSYWEAVNISPSN